MPVSVELTDRYVLVRELDECSQRTCEQVAKLLVYYDADGTHPGIRSQLVSMFVVGEYETADDVPDTLRTTEADYIIKTALGRI